MASNSFGTLFKITTWGESHGKAIGVVIDGCPAGLEISEEEIREALELRRPGRTAMVSARQEKDAAEIYSGVFEGKTTGAPISILLPNVDADSNPYAPIRHLLRPGHANFTYLKKYGIFDDRGGGRASARETACRVAAGAIGKKLLRHFGVDVVAYTKEIAGIESRVDTSCPLTLRHATRQSPLFCPDPVATVQMTHAIEAACREKDSWGGIVEVIAFSLKIGLGDPVYEKLEANLAKAMLSLPATKGFEIGEGFAAARMRGSEHNDPFTLGANGSALPETNRAGGTLAGISTGQPLIARIAFKPTSSIGKIQQTVNLDGQKAEFQLPEGARHDPCVAIRAVPVVEAMMALVLCDALLMNRSSQLTPSDTNDRSDARCEIP